MTKMRTVSESYANFFLRFINVEFGDDWTVGLERERWKHSMPIVLAVFLAANVVSGVSLQEVYAHAKELKPLHRGFEVPILLTLMDLVTCCILLKGESKQSWKIHLESIVVCLLSHVGATYMLNLWFTFHRKSSYMIGYFEPIVMVTLLKVCAGSNISTKLFFSLIFISLCTEMTSGTLFTFLNANRNGIVLFLCIFFMCLRNILLKHLQDENLTLKLRKSVIVPYSFTVLSVGSVLSAFHLTYWALPVMFALITMFSQIVIFYCVVLLLQHYHITSLSVLGVWAQLLMNIACMSSLYFSHFVVSVLAVSALIGATYLYISYIHEIDSPQSHSQLLTKKVSKDEMYTRIEFLLFVGCVIGILFVVFQPKISERDLNNLHYSGLDLVLKKLLNHQT